MASNTLGGCALLLLSTVPASARGSQGDLEAGFQEWKQEHGPGWHLTVDDHTGRAAFLGGGRALLGAPPADDGQAFALARRAVELTRGVTGLTPEGLVEDRATYLPFGLVGGTDKLALRFRQQLGGVPVRGGTVSVLLDLEGRLLSLQTAAAPEVASIALAPALDAERAAAIALADFEAREGLSGALVAAPELVVARPQETGRAAAALAWALDLQWSAEDSVPEGSTYLLDAATGEVLARAPNVHHLDVGGTVTCNTTPDTLPDGGANPPAQLPMAHLRVTSAAGTVFTDSNGVFNLPGVAGPLQCTFEFLGPFADVDNDAGAEYSFQAQLNGPGNAVSMNPTPTEFVTAQANAMRGISSMRDWIRAVNPGDTAADAVLSARVNLNITCNAYFNGTTVHFARANAPCPNMAYSTVLAHEEGHWLNITYGTGNGLDGMGEGNADVFAMYLHDTPLVGESFCGAGCHVRDGNNLRQYCGDCCPSCHGGVHADGEVWMGAAWKVRDQLGQVHGDAAGDAIADALFLGWMNAYVQTGIHSVIELQWLTLDDDNGNIDDGTPNHAPIDTGFRIQGFPGHDVVDFGTALCFGDGSGTVCPCANEGDPGGGCSNSAGPGCSLGALPDAGGTLLAAGAIAGQPGLFFQGENTIAGGDGAVFGDGLRCCGTNVVRLAVVVPDGSGAAETDDVQAEGGALSGDTRCYQYWYRDPSSGPCGGGFNLSNGVTISWP